VFEILSHLQKHGVPFVLIGGHAVNYHGYVRSTEDDVKDPASVTEGDRAKIDDTNLH